ncbi:MAG: mechanosensitive ion channel [Deltaproteobacteria bacterium]
MEAGQILELIRFSGLVSAIFVIAVTWFIARVLREVTERITAAFAKNRLLVSQISAFIRFAIYVLGALFAFQSMFSVSKEVLTVLGGTIVVTVGLVLKDQASSVLAGVMILFEKPFQVGDRVSFGGFYGTITNVGLRSVRLVTLDDNEVTIPNSSFLGSPVSSGNSGALTMLVQQDFHIGTDQDIPRAKKIVEECLISSPYFFAAKPWTVLVNEVRLDMMIAVRLRAKAYVLELQYEKAFESDVSQRIYEAFQREGILPPAVLHRSPGRTLHDAA